MSSTAEITLSGNIPANPKTLGETGLSDFISDGVQFETEPKSESNAVGIVDRMMRPSHFLRMVQSQAKDREDILVSDVNDLNLQWQPPEPGVRGRFVIAPKPSMFPSGSRLREWFKSQRTMPLTDMGFRSACSGIERSTATFNKFDNPAHRFLDEFHDYHRRSNSTRGLLIRTESDCLTEETRSVEAIVPGNYNRISNFELSAAVMNRISELYGSVIRGVQVLYSTKANTNYRILFGNPIMKEAKGDDKNILFVMLSFIGCEYGFDPASFNLGVWRMVCANGAMRNDLSVCRASWKRFDSEKKFLKRVNSLLEVSGEYAEMMTKRLEGLQSQKLELHPLAIIDALRSQSLLDKTTAEVAENNVLVLEPETNWDMLNVLTDAAKAHGNLRRRTSVESKALMLAMQPNGFNGVAVAGVNKTSAFGDLSALRAAARFN